MMFFEMWDMKTGACLHILKGHYDGVVALKLKADDSLLFSSSKDKTIMTWCNPSHMFFEFFRLAKKLNPRLLSLLMLQKIKVMFFEFFKLAKN